VNDPNDTIDPDDDRDLVDRLRAADPGAHLPPADPTRVDRLLEDAMSESTAAPRSRKPLTWLVAAAAVVLVAAGGAFAVLGGDDEPPPPTAGPSETTTALRVTGSGSGRCMVPSPDVLGGAAHAVDAEVTAVEAGTATLDPTAWYAGEETDVVEVDAGSADLEALIGAPRFEEGQRYLVAANEEGEVMVCGFSGPWSDQLADLYAEAFGR
jgi:hypothetical protein